ncbi:hypothetical protein TRFO_20194 [Tritrichomonas foetus]|uniref:Uncharacterized protein n=1 Tax=Tritrichomonas foetus TaxID=1144522 RepID=A0A1J4KLF4_9EUKA|nr:hypothetical protein TRFO_20194 [Tritrichomonas foetus]|eukprot:OHT10518.1 hypothetical protein TRFO_20194 [Tritrichomonas foetus]
MRKRSQNTRRNKQTVSAPVQSAPRITITESRNNDQTGFFDKHPIAKTILSVTGFFIFAILSLLFTKHYKFPQLNYSFDMKGDTPFASILDFYGYHKNQLSSIQNIYPVVIGTSLFYLYRNFNCDYELSALFSFIAIMDSGFSSFLQSSNSHFFHVFLTMLTFFFQGLLFHEKAFSTIWFILNAFLSFFISLNFCNRVESLPLIVSYIYSISITVRKTSLSFSPRKPTKILDIIKIVSLNCFVSFVTIFIFKSTIGLPKFRKISFSIDDIFDEYKIIQFGYTLIVFEILAVFLFAFKFTYLNSYDSLLLISLALTFVSNLILPVFSGESALATKIFDGKLNLVMMAGIVIGRPSRLYLSYTLLLIGLFTTWVERYKFKPLGEF